MKKFTILTLVLAMLLASFSACGDSTADSSSSVDTAAMEETKETTALEARAAIPDDLPERDYSGANFISLWRRRHSQADRRRTGWGNCKRCHLQYEPAGGRTV